ncbi:carbohydrate kinase family protein [Streptomyces xanthochromogenes]|uniref:Carbohydrate kinase PfkB domain-containing protein n=1 Tax=Streptomyces xanthochromogenes TaxID=67384 RepID=A0ABQ2ZHR8_9ACTN|nr:PfkB family carbohydrate kinase [Streptomyces xanthochromogenes]GGY13543.1 hypothetical protein GCM10010326_01040 [Streptomyces xanthochromogenes]
MSPIARWDLACFSYLAHAQILHVSRYPSADHGATVDRVRVSLAGDGPIAACTAAAQGLRTTLVANQVGDDLPGMSAATMLRTAGVGVQVTRRRPAVTPSLTVITDGLGTRTWFADLAHVEDSLYYADMSPLARARLAYIDAYTVIATSAARAISTAAQAHVPVLLNLGNDPIHPDIAEAARRAHLVAVQTGLPEAQAHQADALARSIADQLRPAVAVVTLGSLGAVAQTKTGEPHRISAHPARIVDTHGAGAAFSAGFAAAHLDGADLTTTLRAACTAGTDHCSRPREAPRTLPHPAATPSLPA